MHLFTMRMMIVMISRTAMKMTIPRPIQFITYASFKALYTN